MIRMRVAVALAVLGSAGAAWGQIVPTSRASTATAGFTGFPPSAGTSQTMETTGFEDVEWSFQTGGVVTQTSRITDSTVLFDGSGFGYPGGGAGQRYARSSMVLEFSIPRATRFRLTGELFVNGCPCYPSPKAWVRLYDISNNLMLAEAALLPEPGQAMFQTLPFDLERAMPAGQYRLDFNAEGQNYTAIARGLLTVEPACYANCDGSTQPPVLNVNDFVCFQAAYAAGDPSANCDGSTAPPILNVNDFICFQSTFAAGCP